MNLASDIGVIVNLKLSIQVWWIISGYAAEDNGSPTPRTHQ
ncbi:Uncharacterised protein [Chlamydia trachomatis]|nr:Uncharacterised protein [Chlamydia trachomatis]